MAETRNIVILGASYAGLSAAHYLVRHTLPKLQQSKAAKYVIHLVDPSTHFWHHISAPRAIVSTKEMSHKDVFIPIADGFKKYSHAKDSIVFHQGEATSLNTDARIVTVKRHDGAIDESLQYYALVISTGVRSSTPLTTLQGPHTISQAALDETNRKLASAKEIVIGGGGPVGVETAGEIAAHLKGKGATITLIAGGGRLVPVLRQSLSDKAQKILEKNGVRVVYGAKVTSAAASKEGAKTTVELDNGSTITADVYIPAAGVRPNTAFVPAALLTPKAHLDTDPATFRVTAAGPRVYAVGDVAGVDPGGIMNLYSALPIFAANVSHDLLVDAAAVAPSAVPHERKYAFKPAESQVVPIGPKTGVGAFNGTKLPGFAIAMIKGKDYFKKTIPDFTEGNKWKKP